MNLRANCVATVPGTCLTRQILRMPKKQIICLILCRDNEIENNNKRWTIRSWSDFFYQITKYCCWRYFSATLHKVATLKLLLIISEMHFTSNLAVNIDCLEVFHHLLGLAFHMVSELSHNTSFQRHKWPQTKTSIHSFLYSIIFVVDVIFLQCYLTYRQNFAATVPGTRLTRHLLSLPKKLSSKLFAWFSTEIMRSRTITRGEQFDHDRIFSIKLRSIVVDVIFLQRYTRCCCWLLVKCILPPTWL